MLEHDGQLATDIFEVTPIIIEPSYCCVQVTDARGKSDLGNGSNDYYIEFSEKVLGSSYLFFENMLLDLLLANMWQEKESVGFEIYWPTEECLTAAFEDLPDSHLQLLYA